jgi:hypothetical protein
MTLSNRQDTVVLKLVCLATYLYDFMAKTKCEFTEGMLLQAFYVAVA